MAAFGYLPVGLSHTLRTQARVQDQTLRSFFAGFRAAGDAIHLAQVDEGDGAAGDLR